MMTPVKMIYNEIYPCIFQPKSKVLPNRRSVYQLLSKMRSGKRGNLLSFKATTKTHATYAMILRYNFPCSLTTYIF